MKHIKLYEEFIEEATTSWKKMMQGVRSSETGPWSIVAIQDRKVVGQSIDIKIKELIPAKYEALKREFPKAKFHIEDGTGMVVWNESLEINESLINEDSSMAFFILMQAAIVNGFLINQMANSGGGDGFHPIDDLKAWWQKRKSDKALKSIIDKIKGDEDVVKFMKLTPSQQRGKFRALIATKLNDEELEYLNKINRNHFQTESLEEGTYNSSREIAIYDGEDGLTYIEKRGKGYYGYNDEFDFEATDKADLEKKLKSWKYKLISGSIDEKIEYPEGVKTTDDKILDKVAKLLHSPKGIIEIGSGSVRGKKIPFQTDDSAYFNITGQKDHYVLLCKNGEFEIPRNEIKNAEELYDQIEKAIQMGTITKGKKK